MSPKEIEFEQYQFRAQRELGMAVIKEVPSATEGAGSAARGLFRTGKHLGREFIVAPFNAEVRQNVAIENAIINKAAQAFVDSHEVRSAVFDMVGQRIAEDPGFAVGRLAGGGVITALTSQASAAKTGSKLDLKTKFGVGILNGFLAGSGDAREAVHQGVTNPEKIFEFAIFGFDKSNKDDK